MLRQHRSAGRVVLRSAGDVKVRRSILDFLIMDNVNDIFRILNIHYSKWEGRGEEIHKDMQLQYSSYMYVLIL